MYPSIMLPSTSQFSKCTVFKRCLYLKSGGYASGSITTSSVC